MSHIRSLAEFVDRIAEIRRFWGDDEQWIEPWFRGHADADWSPVPNTWRNGESFDLTTEYEFRDEFQRRGIQLIDGHRIPLDKGTLPCSTIEAGRLCNEHRNTEDRGRRLLS